MAKIRGFGAYLPARIVDNDEIGRLCGAEPAWIKQQTGIERRRWAAPEERVADLGILAARDCLEKCGADATEIGLVLVASGSGERRSSQQQEQRRPHPCTAAIRQSSFASRRLSWPARCSTA